MISRDRVKEVWSVVNHAPSLLSIIVVALALGIHSPLGFITFNVQEAASSIFQVSGTMVALALPAAQLASYFVTQMEEVIRTIVRDLRQDRSVEELTSIRQQLEDTIDEHKKVLYTALRATVYVLIAFIISGIAIILPPLHISIGESYAVLMHYFLIGAAMTSLLVGSLWFYPSVIFAFRLRAVNTIHYATRTLIDQRLSLQRKSQSK